MQVKSAEPVLSVALSQLILGERNPPYVWLSLLPIIAGCSLAAMKEVGRKWIAEWCCSQGGCVPGLGCRVPGEERRCSALMQGGLVKMHEPLRRSALRGMGSTMR